MLAECKSAMETIDNSKIRLRSFYRGICTKNTLRRMTFIKAKELAALADWKILIKRYADAHKMALKKIK